MIDDSHHSENYAASCIAAATFATIYVCSLVATGIIWRLIEQFHPSSRGISRVEGVSLLRSL